jgi:DNA gyrase subunit B
MVEAVLEEAIEGHLGQPCIAVDFFPENRVTIQLTGVDAQRLAQDIGRLQSADLSTAGLYFGVLLTLSASISITICAQGTSTVLRGQSGDFETTTHVVPSCQEGAWIDFVIDQEIFQDFQLDVGQCYTVLRQFAYLNPGLKLILTDQSTAERQRNVFFFPMGVRKLLDDHIALQTYGSPLVRLDIAAQVDGYAYIIGISFVYNWRGGSLVKTFAGNTATYWGGSLEEGIWDGILQAIRKTAREQGLDIPIRRKIFKEDWAVIAAVRGAEFVFAGSTKRKLHMPQLRKAVCQLVCKEMNDHLAAHPQESENLLRKFGG